MAIRVLPFTVTIPAGTLPAAPYTQDLDLANWVIEQIVLEVPPGPAGLMGFQVYNNGVAWLPYGGDQWLVWDDVQQSWPLTDQPNASGWAIVGYNAGFYDHSVTVRMHVDTPGSPASTALASQPTFAVSALPEQEVVTLG